MVFLDVGEQLDHAIEGAEQERVVSLGQLHRGFEEAQGGFETVQKFRLGVSGFGHGVMACFQEVVPAQCGEGGSEFSHGKLSARRVQPG